MLRALAFILGLTISVSPSISFAPATLNVKVKLEPKAENRLLEWSIESGEFGQSSLLDLAGADSPKTFFLPQWKSVPEGDYVITAVIYNSAGRIIERAVTKVQVKGFGQ